jgi:hypothetical protein
MYNKYLKFTTSSAQKSASAVTLKTWLAVEAMPPHLQWLVRKRTFFGRSFFLTGKKPEDYLPCEMSRGSLIYWFTRKYRLYLRIFEKRAIFTQNIHCLMMTKQEHIDYWVRTAAEDWITVETLFTTERYMHCLF